MHFVITCYGERYAPFLAVCLRSVRLFAGSHSVTVINDLPESVIACLKAANPNATFIHLIQYVTSLSQYEKRVAGKLDYWLYWMTSAPNGRVVVFIDADVFVRADISGDLPSDFDVMFTRKEERIPINTGVLALRVSDSSKAFMQLWRDETFKVFSDPDLLAHGVKVGGGISQFTLLRLMGVPDGGQTREGLNEVDLSCGTIRFFGAECDLLNQTNSVPLSSPAKILHYKAGWHPILLDGKKFSRNRPYHESAEMYQFWLDHLRAEEHLLGMQLLSRWTRSRHAMRSLVALLGRSGNNGAGYQSR